MPFWTSVDRLQQCCIKLYDESFMTSNPLKTNIVEAIGPVLFSRFEEGTASISNMKGSGTVREGLSIQLEGESINLSGIGGGASVGPITIAYDG